MSSARRTTLLELVIAASIAVVPVLIAALWIAASWRASQGHETPLASGQRFLNVRLLAAAETFEHAIVARRAVTAPPPSAAQLLSGLPECREEWSRDAGLVASLAMRFGFPAAAAGPTPAERLAARLAELDRALQGFSARANRRVADAVGFDGARWLAAAQSALQASVRSAEYPERAFRLRCSDIAAAVEVLTRRNAALLELLAWRGSEPAAVAARWRTDQVMQVPARALARRNPWSGRPGCVYMGQVGPEGRFLPTHYLFADHGDGQRLCADRVMAGVETARSPVGLPHLPPGAPADHPGWSVPPSASALIAALDTLRSPEGRLYQHYTEERSEGEANTDPTQYRYGANRIRLNGTLIDVGFSVDLTIDPAMQALAQKIAACYTGHQAACGALSVRRREDARKAIGHRLLERAVVRMAAIAIIDIPSGRIEALAGAFSPCTREALDGPGRSPACDPRLPQPARYSADALLNPAVYHDAMPASIIKPIMATAFLTDPEVGARWLDAERRAAQAGGAIAAGGLRAELLRSDSKAFLDRMFCAERGYLRCERPQRIQAAAELFGWNGDCREPRASCGRTDLLFGRALDAVALDGRVQPLSAPVLAGRLLVEPSDPAVGAAFQRSARPSPPPDAVRRCAAGADGHRPSQDDWEKCRVPAANDSVAEGWGQGNARTTALGGAAFMATLGAAANAQAEVRGPHLVHAIRGVAPERAALDSAVLRWHLAEPKPNAVPRAVADLILGALASSHAAGTARPACEEVFDASTCQRLDWVAGKTGTPTFPNDERSLDEIARLCKGTAAGRTRPAACGALRPYKWYVAVWRDPASRGPWTKAIGVLTERNWLAGSGRIHVAGERGPNPAVEIALQIAARHAGVLPSQRAGKDP